jgi:hypothetical protein
MGHLAWYVVAVFALLLVYSLYQKLRDKSSQRPDLAQPPQPAAAPDQDVTSSPFIRRSLTETFTHKLDASQKRVIEQWLGVANGQWTEADKQKFAAAVERYLWDGEDLPLHLRLVSGTFRKALPTLEGTPLNIDIPPEVRAILRDLFHAPGHVHLK